MAALTLTDYLLLCCQRQASDLHLSTAQTPYIRVDGDLMALAHPHLMSAQMTRFLSEALTTEQALKLHNQRSVDFAYMLPTGQRFRGHAFWQRLGPSLVFRRLNTQIPSLHELHAPDVLASLTHTSQGLILCTGATGSGKSTTLAAMVARINQHQQKHLISLEAPIEYLHQSASSLISQRDLDSDALDLSTAIKDALRADPDVLVLGELRDLNSIRMALTAAETGHLVLATLHSASAATTIHRIVDVFPETEKSLIQAQLATSLVAIVAQTLVKRKSVPGRVAAFEVLIKTPAVAHLIREYKMAQIPNILQTQQAVGMQTMAQSLTQLKQQGLI